MERTMNVTVILCTYNRSRSLAKALTSAAALNLPEDVDWEILVIDNNSSDQTRAVIEGFCQSYPGRFRYLFEPKPGKSNALNAGIQAARGDVLAFMDDDVIVEPTWLQNLIPIAPLHDDTWAGTGGRIIPDWTSSPPRWMPVNIPHALAPLAAFDLGPEAHQLSESPFGTNMAFRREVFEKYGGFRTDLGPAPGTMVRSEDTEFGNRLLAAGERLRYEPHQPSFTTRSRRISLQRKILPGLVAGQRPRRYIREVVGPHPRTRYELFGIPLYLFPGRLAVWTLLRWLVAMEPRLRFHCKIKVWGLWGQLAESHRQSLDQCRTNPIELKR